MQAIQDKLGVPYEYGAWSTARHLLRDCWKHKPSVVRDASFDLRDLPFSGAARDIAWRRELEQYMIGYTVHHFDKNSQYLAADRGVKTGVGDPTHIADGDDDTHIVPGLPGIYKVDWWANDSFTREFPPIIEPGQEWVTNDVLVFALEHGYDVFIEEAWVWHDYTKILDPWAKRLWDARVALKGVNDDAYDKIKEIAVVGNGAWATSKIKHPGIDLIHPNWWADTVGKSRVNLLANLLKYGAPVCIETDGLYYITRDSNWRTAVPGILDRMNELGGYKHEGSFTLTPELYQKAQGRSVGKLAELFKEAAGER